MLEGEERMRCPGWFATADHIDVGRENMVGIEEAHDSSDHAAPISPLSYWKSYQTT